MNEIISYLIKESFNWNFHQALPCNEIHLTIDGVKMEIPIPIGLTLEEFKGIINVTFREEIICRRDKYAQLHKHYTEKVLKYDGIFEVI